MTVILNNETFKDLTKDLLNLKVVEIYLVQYVSPNGEADNSDVELEIVYNKDSFFRLSSASDGERVTIHRSPWIDPFTEPVSLENQRYINESGKWRLFVVNDHPLYASIIGKNIKKIQKIINKFGVLAGLAFTFDNKTLCYCVDCDEGKIFWDEDNTEMGELGFKLQ